MYSWLVRSPKDDLGLTIWYLKSCSPEPLTVASGATCRESVSMELEDTRLVSENWLVWKNPKHLVPEMLCVSGGWVFLLGT